MLDEILRLRAPTDVYAFGEYVFGYRPAEHHIEMVDFIEEGYRAKQNTLVLEPRGAAKTTWSTTIWVTHKIATNPHIRVGLFSKTAQHAFDMSRGIRLTLDRNAAFREVFGHLVSAAKWTDAQWLRAGSRWHGSKDATLFANGVGGQVVSKRFDLLYMDDILDDENTANVEQMERVRTWFWKTAMPCLTPDGVVIIAGTRWADGDLYEELLTPKPEGKGWRNLVRGALIPVEGGYRSYWPSVWSIEKLMDMKDGMGSALFSCAYLNDVSGLMEGNMIHAEHFKWFSTLPEGHRFTVRMGIDLASSEKETADFTARVTTAEDEDGNFYVLSYHRERLSSGHAQFVANGWSVYPQMDAIIVEKVAYQSTLITELMRDFSHLPVMGGPPEGDKTSRVRAISAKMEAGKVFFHHSIRDSDFHRELVSFPKGHDDLCDALFMSMDLGGLDFSWAAVQVA